MVDVEANSRLQRVEDAKGYAPHQSGVLTSLQTPSSLPSCVRQASCTVSAGLVKVPSASNLSATNRSEDVETASDATVFTSPMAKSPLAGGLCETTASDRTGRRRAPVDLEVTALDETIPVNTTSVSINGLNETALIKVDSHSLRDLCAQQAARIAHLEKQLEWQGTSSPALESQLVQELRVAWEKSCQAQAQSDARVEQLALAQAELQAQNQELLAEVRMSSRGLETLRREVQALRNQQGVVRLTSVGPNLSEEKHRSVARSASPLAVPGGRAALSPSPVSTQGVSHVARVPLKDANQLITSAAAALAAASPLARAPNGSVMPSPMFSSKKFEGHPLPSSPGGADILRPATGSYDAFLGPRRVRESPLRGTEIRHMPPSLGAPPPSARGSAQQQSPRESMSGGSSIQTSSGCSLQAAAGCSLVSPRCTSSPLPINGLSRQLHASTPLRSGRSHRSTLNSSSTPQLSFSSMAPVSVAQM